MKTTPREWLLLGTGLLISAVALILTLRQVDLAEVGAALQRARYGYILLGAVMMAGIMVLRGWRWQVLTQGRVTFADGVWLFCVGFLFNNVLPARLGEVVRAVLAARRPQMEVTSALASIVVERLFDLVAVGVLFGLALVGLDLPVWAFTTGLIAGGGAIIGIGVLALTAHNPTWALTLGTTLLAVLPGITREKAHDFLHPFVDGLGGVSDWGTFSAGLALSIGAWLISGVMGWVMMLAFWEQLPLLMGQLAVAAAGLGLIVPSAPSGIGPFEAAVVGALGAAGLNQTLALSFALAFHAVQFVVPSALGVIGLVREGVGFSSVVEDARSLRAE